MEVNGVQFVDTPASGSGARIAKDFDTFLTLLTTQLQNQDPLSPMDTTEFTNQITQFAQVEQGINTNQKLDQLVEAQAAGQLTTGVAFIGKLAEVPGSRLQLADGQARLGYELEGSAAETTISIIDDQGTVVRRVAGAVEAGKHEFSWDGIDDRGDAVEDGVYSVFVVSVDGDNNTVPTTTTTFARVTGVEVDQGEVSLNLGPVTAGIKDVRSLNEVP